MDINFSRKYFAYWVETSIYKGYQFFSLFLRVFNRSVVIDITFRKEESHE
jgi:hypothetical protein